LRTCEQEPLLEGTLGVLADDEVSMMSSGELDARALKVLLSGDKEMNAWLRPSMAW